MSKRNLEQPTCYYCHRFITWYEAFNNWTHIQAPGVMDPEPYEIMWCNQCAYEGKTIERGIV